MLHHLSTDDEIPPLPRPPPQAMVDNAKIEYDFDVEGLKNGSGESYFPKDLPPRPGPPPKSRSRRRLWTFSLSSFSIVHTSDRQARIRHIVMIMILVLQTASSALSVLSAISKRDIAGTIVYSLLAVLSLWFTATCLAIIGDAAGDKRFEGAIMKRWHFDFFLGFCLIIHALLIILFFFGLGGLGLEMTGIGMWFLILGVAWIAGWQPEIQMPMSKRKQAL